MPSTTPAPELPKLFEVNQAFATALIFSGGNIDLDTLLVRIATELGYGGEPESLRPQVEAILATAVAAAEVIALAPKVFYVARNTSAERNDLAHALGEGLVEAPAFS